MKDRVLRAVGWYGDRKGSLLAAAVTYFGFLSFFPILALAFAAVGLVAGLFPDAEDALTDALRDLLPGMIGSGPQQISIADIRSASGAAAGIGAVTVLYAGTGWIAGMRDALHVMFDLPEPETADSPVGKARQWATTQLRNTGALVAIGGVLIVSVGISGLVTGVISLGAVPAGIVTSTVLFLVMFRLLAHPPLPRNALIAGALLGGVAFEVLKQASRFLLASTAGQPAFQAFGIALILLVWIHYFSRVVMFAAAWSATDEKGRTES